MPDNSAFYARMQREQSYFFSRLKARLLSGETGPWEAEKPIPYWAKFARCRSGRSYHAWHPNKRPFCKQKSWGKHGPQEPAKIVKLEVEPWLACINCRRVLEKHE